MNDPTERKGVTLITKYSVGDMRQYTNPADDTEGVDTLSSFSAVDYQELQCPAANTKRFSIYDYNGVAIVEMHGQVMRTKFHRHDYFEFIMPQSESVDMQIESMLCSLDRWDVCILNRATRHSEHFKRGDSVCYLHLSADYMRDEPGPEKAGFRSFDRLSQFFYKDLGDQTTRHKDYIHLRYIGGERISPLVGIFAQIRGELERKEPGYQMLVHALVYRMFCMLNDPAIFSARHINLGSDDGVTLAQSTKRMLDQTNRKITKDELSERLNYDAEYINRIFKRHYGCSIPEYNRRRCMSLAADMLQSTRLTVSEICRRVGYKNRTQFYNIFSKQYGCAPTEYRERHQSGVLLNRPNDSESEDDE